MNNSFPPPQNPNKKGFPKLPGSTPPPPPAHSSGRISGFPAPPKPKAVPPTPDRRSSRLPQPPTVPSRSRVYSPPPAPNQEPVEAEKVEAPSEEDIIVISEEEIKDMKDYRAAINVKFMGDVDIYKLAASPDHVVRQELAMNPDTPGQVLTILANDPHPQVREEVVYNASTPQTTYEEMVEDRSTWIKEALLTNPRTTFSMLKKIDVGDDIYLKSLLDKRL